MSVARVVGFLIIGSAGALGCSAEAENPSASLPFGMGANGGMSAGGTTGGAGGMPPTGGSGSGSGASGGAGGAAAGAGGAIPSAGSGGMSAGMGGGGMDMNTDAGASGMAAGAGGMMSGGAGGGGMEEPGRVMPCMTDGSELLIIGDSYVSYINPLQPALEAEASAAGQLPAGQSYENLAVPGTFIAQIQQQWESGKAGSPKYVVMDGGGNDVLIGAPQCLDAGAGSDPSCIAVADGALEIGAEMMADMKASGVAGVVYFFYPHVPAGGDELLDYTLPLIEENCAALRDATFDCAVVDLIPAFAGKPELILFDGIHPTGQGQEVIADLIWTAMEDHCFGHMNGCCM